MSLPLALFAENILQLEDYIRFKLKKKPAVTQSYLTEIRIKEGTLQVQEGTGKWIFDKS